MTGIIANTHGHKIKTEKSDQQVNSSDSGPSLSPPSPALNNGVDINNSVNSISLGSSINNCIVNSVGNCVGTNGTSNIINSGINGGLNNSMNNSSSNNRDVNGQKTSGPRRGRYDPRYVDVIRERPIRVTAKVLVPVREHPKFNFVGKLLGPKGNSMKRLQEETLTKMAVLGKGSMRDKQKEEELRASADPKYLHLLEDLHVEITAFAPPAEAHARIAYSLAEIRRYLVPDNNDDIRKQQIREMEYMGDGRKAGEGGGLMKSVADGGAGVEAVNGHGGGARMEVDERGGGRNISPSDLRRSDPSSPGSPSRIPPIGGNILPPLHHALPPPLPHPHPHPHHRSRSAHSPLGPSHHSPLGPHPHDLPPPPPRLLPWGCGSSRRRVLTILDKAKMALDHSYEEDGYSDYFYEEYDDYGPLDEYSDLYAADCYDGASGGWSRYKPLLPAARERSVRCRTSPYTRPK